MFSRFDMTGNMPSETALPVHIAIIMDGNGRWATRHGLSRTQGHRKGAEAAQKIVQAARDAGIRYVTLFTFSSENWNRPASEVGDLMDLLRYYLRKETAEMHKSGACLKVINDRARLPEDIVSLVEQAEEITKDNTQITVVIALSYGGRQELVATARRLAAKASSGEIKAQDIDETVFTANLMTAGIPDPDLVIRTGGEHRVSNFLLWQLAYSEFYFSDVYWPDFSPAHFTAALEDYAGRQRRFGGLADQQMTGEG